MASGDGCVVPGGREGRVRTGECGFVRCAQNDNFFQKFSKKGKDNNGRSRFPEGMTERKAKAKAKARAKATATADAGSFPFVALEGGDDDEQTGMGKR